MANDIKIMKAVEFDKLSAKTKRHWGSVQAMVDAGWLVQDKYDGCFGMAIMKADGNHQMLSRTGETVRSCDHILRELAQAADDRAMCWDDFVVLGEVWHPVIGFPTISGKFRRHSAAVDLQFAACDLLAPSLETAIPYHERFAQLSKLLPEMEGAMTFVARCMERNPPNDVAQYARDLQAIGGYDGAIVRDPDAGYTIGLVKNGEIVKVKPLLSLDLKVAEVTEAVGGKTGRAVYTLTVLYKGVRTEVGSGMPHSSLDLPSVGDIVQIDSLGLTEDGKLREPRFIGIRHDKTEPD